MGAVSSGAAVGAVSSGATVGAVSSGAAVSYFNNIMIFFGSEIQCFLRKYHS